MNRISPQQQQSLLLSLESIKQEIVLGYTPGVRVLCESLAKRARSLAEEGYPSFHETQRTLDRPLNTYCKAHGYYRCGTCIAAYS